jgi:hypothetical protein
MKVLGCMIVLGVKILQAMIAYLILKVVAVIEFAKCLFTVTLGSSG